MVRRKEIAVLSLQIESGGYITINGNIIIQLFAEGFKIRVHIEAPKEIPVLRGDVAERNGAKRPRELMDKAPKNLAKRIGSARQLEKYMARKEQEQAAMKEHATVFAEMNRILDRMELSLKDSGSAEQYADFVSLQGCVDRLIAIEKEKYRDVIC